MSASLCIGLGATPRDRPKIVTMVNGRVRRATNWSAPAYTPDGMACQSAADCVVGGSVIDRSTGFSSGGMVATVSHGRMGPAQRIPGAQSLFDVTCSRTACFAIGAGGGHGIVVPVAGGSVGDPIRVRSGVDAQTCSPRRCLGISVGTLWRITYSVNGAP
jgi:hypothetical protein